MKKNELKDPYNMYPEKREDYNIIKEYISDKTEKYSICYEQNSSCLDFIDKLGEDFVNLNYILFHILSLSRREDPLDIMLEIFENPFI